MSFCVFDLDGVLRKHIITEEQVALVEERMRKDSNKNVYKRLQVIALLGKGKILAIIGNLKNGETLK